MTVPAHNIQNFVKSIQGKSCLLRQVACVADLDTAPSHIAIELTQRLFDDIEMAHRLLQQASAEAQDSAANIALNAVGASWGDLYSPDDDFEPVDEDLQLRESLLIVGHGGVHWAGEPKYMGSDGLCESHGIYFNDLRLIADSLGFSFGLGTPQQVAA